MTQKITVLIYGKDTCPYCEKAKALVSEIQKKNKVELVLDYHNFIEENLTKEDITKKISAPSLISTVPQIKLFFADSEKYIGGFAEFYAYVIRETDWLK